MTSVKDKLFYFLLLIISFFLVEDLFLHQGQAATFDGPTHITTIAQFYRALSNGDLKVEWAAGFANYGSPIPLIVHQTTNYLGGVLSFIFHNFIFTYNFLLLIGAFCSAFFFYRFLRIYFSPEVSLLGAVIFNFSPYRIINIYIRGDLPEFFSSLFPPLILIALHSFFKSRNLGSVVLLLVSLVGLVLTHPMLFVIYSFLFFPYLIYLIFVEFKVESKRFIEKIQLKSLIFLAVIFLFALGISAYYLFPLLLEIKYFTYGIEPHSKIPLDQFTSFKNFLDPRWYYFYQQDIFVRGHLIKIGVIEFASICIGLLYLLYKWLIKKDHKVTLLEYSVITGWIVIFFTTSYSSFFYSHIPFLAAIQFPWRLFSSLMFIPSIIFAYCFKNVKKIWLIGIVILFFSLQYEPQLYGKNFTLHSNNDYLFTKYNLQSNSLNTVWTGNTEDYPVKTQKYAILAGKGQVESSTILNSKHSYKVNAVSDLRMIDYTFYFPGWNVYIDGKSTPVQFQDPNYRGVITFSVPPGEHTIVVKFEETKIRKLGDMLSFLSLLTAVIVLLFIWKNKKFQKNLLSKSLN